MDKPTLVKQTGISLMQRSEMFIREFPDAKMNVALLRRIYKQHGIQRRRIKWVKKVKDGESQRYNKTLATLKSQLAKAKKE